MVLCNLPPSGSQTYIPGTGRGIHIEIRKFRRTSFDMWNFRQGKYRINDTSSLHAMTLMTNILYAS